MPGTLYVTPEVVDGFCRLLQDNRKFKYQVWGTAGKRVHDRTKARRVAVPGTNWPWQGN